MNATGIGGFSKGQSGNPGGRRKKTAEDIEIQQLARQHGPTAIDALAKTATYATNAQARGIEDGIRYGGCVGRTKGSPAPEHGISGRSISTTSIVSGISIMSRTG
jgi:hypothetical protein